MAFLGGQQKLIVILVLFVAVFALVLGVFIGHSFLVVPPNTQTQTWNWYGWTGLGENPGGQLLDASSYATSWSFADASEKIVIQGGARIGTTFACVAGAQYQVWTSTDGVGWTQVSGSPFPVNVGNAFLAPGGSIAYPAYVYSLIGPFSGALKVDLQLHIVDLAAPGVCSVGLDKGFLTVAEDQAYLVSSAFNLNADSQAQVGSTAHATVSVGYLTTKTGGPGWKFWAFSSAQNKVVLGPFESGTAAWNQAQQTFSYQITAADFDSTAGVCGHGNFIQWTLYNELWPRGWAITTTIDVSSFAPSFKFTGWKGNNVENGSINVSWTAAQNPTTQSPLTGIHLDVGYGSPHGYNLSASQTSYTLQLGQNGLLKVSGYSIDAACRPSKVDSFEINVYPRGQQPPGQGPPNWWVFFGILLVFVAVAGVAAWYTKGPLWTRFVVFFAIALLGVVLALIAQPNVLNPLTYAAGMIVGRLRGG